MVHASDLSEEAEPNLSDTQTSHIASSTSPRPVGKRIRHSGRAGPISPRQATSAYTHLRDRPTKTRPGKKNSAERKMSLQPLWATPFMGMEIRRSRSYSTPFEIEEPEINRERRRSSNPENSIKLTKFGYAIPNMFVSLSDTPESEQPSPRGSNPLSDLDIFKVLKEDIEATHRNNILTIEDFFSLHFEERKQRSYILPNGSDYPDVYMIPLILHSKNLFNIENILTRYLLPILSTEKAKWFNVFYEGTGLSPNCTVLIYYFFSKKNDDIIKLALPCVNKVGRTSTLHDELARTLRHEATYVQQTKRDSFLIDSFSRENESGLISPFNGALDVLLVSHILDTINPRQKQFIYGVSWGGMAADIVHNKTYYHFLHPKREDITASKMKAKLILTINGMPLYQENPMDRFEGTLRVNLHGTHDNLFTYDDAVFLAQNNGTHVIPVIGGGHNFHMFETHENEKLSNCFDFKELCMTFDTLPSVESTQKLHREYTAWFRALSRGQNSDFLTLPSFLETTARMALNPDQGSISLNAIIHNYNQKDRVLMTYGTSPASSNGILNANYAIISIIKRLTDKTNNKKVQNIPLGRIQQWTTITPKEQKYLQNLT